MNRILVVLLLLVFPRALFAGKHAPLPEGVTAAKTVYIVNQTGEQSVADGAYDAFTKWGRMVVTQNRNDAGLIVTFTRDGRLIDGTDYAAVDMTVFVPDSPDAAYQTTARVRFHAWAHAAKDCVNGFRKRAEAHPSN